MSPVLSGRDLDFAVSIFAIIGLVVAVFLTLIIIRVLAYGAHKALERVRERRLAELERKRRIWSIAGED